MSVKLSVEGSNCQPVDRAACEIVGPPVGLSLISELCAIPLNNLSVNWSLSLSVSCSVGQTIMDCMEGME